MGAVSPSTGSVPPGTPSQLNMAGASAVTPASPAMEPVGTTYIGYSLAKIFSAILFFYLLVALCSVWYSEARMMSKMDALTGLLISRQKQAAPTKESGSEMQSPAAVANPGNTATDAGKVGVPNGGVTRDDLEVVMKAVGDRYRDTRAMTVDFHKTVVVNVLFPILTALLGYIFASREKN